MSYTLSRTFRDGVNHYQNYPGTMRTPHERGYGEQDTRHNLSVSAARAPLRRPVQRHPPRAQRHAVRRVGGLRHRRRRPDPERPAGGLPITVGREDVEESLNIINALRATRNLAPITSDQLKLEPFIALDLRATKDFSVGHGRRIEVFLEGYNILNRVNYAGGGNGSIISPALLIRNAARIRGRFSSARGSRSERRRAAAGDERLTGVKSEDQCMLPWSVALARRPGGRRP